MAAIECPRVPRGGRSGLDVERFPGDSCSGQKVASSDFKLARFVILLIHGATPVEGPGQVGVSSQTPVGVANGGHSSGGFYLQD